MFVSWTEGFNASFQLVWLHTGFTESLFTRPHGCGWSCSCHKDFCSCGFWPPDLPSGQTMLFEQCLDHLFVLHSAPHIHTVALCQCLKLSFKLWHEAFRFDRDSGGKLQSFEWSVLWAESVFFTHSLSGSALLSQSEPQSHVFSLSPPRLLWSRSSFSALMWAGKVREGDREILRASASLLLFED